MANKKSKKSSALDKAKKLASKSKKTIAKKQSYPAGQNAPQSKKYTQAADKTISAKPTGYRWTTEGAKKLGKNPANRPSISDIEKYAGKTFKVAKKPNPMSEDGSYRFLYLERRADKADLVRKNKLAQGAELIEGSESGFDFPNDSAFEKGGAIRQKYNKLVARKGDDFYFLDEIFKNSEHFMGATGTVVNPVDKDYYEFATSKDGLMERFEDARVWKESYGIKGEKKLENFIYNLYRDGELNPFDEVSSEQEREMRALPEFSDSKEYPIFEVIGGGRIFGINKKFDEVYDKDLMDKIKKVESGKFKRGGVSQTEPQNWSGNYNEFRDMQRDAKPVGYRYTGQLAKRLRVNPLSKPSAAHIQKYLGKGVYWETRLDKSDRTRRLQDGGVMVDLTTGVNADPRFDIQSPDFMKRGGVSQTEPQNWSGNYNEFRDMQRDAKPVGYRYTHRLAKRLGVNPLSKPSAAHIQKYLGKGVYWETRLDKSDRTRRLQDGGVMMETSIKGGEGLAEFARGGASRISNAESRTYTENHLPFKANNLEGKLLENGDYVVLSYGYYPIWFWNKKENKWYGNMNKYSVTTAKHISQSRPTYTAEMVTREELEKLMLDGQEKHMKEWGGELSAPDFQ